MGHLDSLFVWLVPDGWFVLREKYRWLCLWLVCPERKLLLPGG
jgi:hypothetical protein